MRKKIIDKVIDIFGLFPDLILSIFEKSSKLLGYIFFSARRKKSIKTLIYFQNTEIILNLKKNDNQAHSVYRNLHKKKDTIYELPLISILIEIFKKNEYRNFLDLGAFMGYYSILISKYFNEKNLNVYAIESNPTYCEFIKQNIKENNTSNIKLINAALSDKNEDLFASKEVVSVNNIQDSTKIRSKTLDDVCEEFSIIPDLLKVDVHGFEGKVLNGFKKNLASNAKIILLELHSNQYLDKYSKSNKKKIINFLIDHDYHCYLVPYFPNLGQSIIEKLNIHKVDANFSLSNYKNPCRKINTSNYNDLFFDKEHTENIILAFKDSNEIKKYNCFINLD